MTNYPAPYADAPCADIDPYELRHLLDGHEFHQILKNQAPLVWLTHYGVWATGRHPELTAIFKDHATFCSSRGVGLQDFKKEKPWRAPSLILEVDPPEHTATRKILSSVLSNQALAGLRPAFELEADRLVRQLLDQGEIDGIILRSPIPEPCSLRRWVLPQVTTHPCLNTARWFSTCWDRQTK